ncbi:geranylpyrophosphate:olivetolate geranyltransferase, chloroplastic [Cannabis sativa]|uniref:geranylpyrophosphate:olivetolate geranyltransferase, chloroplastic n=1 Tax=Cannabis sativa TaxID=3483 RepID=UPI0029C9B40F|nr:geranylpyrophosphate:olivetolate geranyltransferase, chloroplastic [Cannabis sativa]
MEVSSVCTFSFQTNYHTLLNPHNKNPKNSLLSYQHPKTPIIKSSYDNFPSKYCLTKNFHLLGLNSHNRISSQSRSIRAGSDQIEGSPHHESDNSIATKILNFGHTCWKLQRPYAVKGMISVACGLFGRELFNNRHLFSWGLMWKAFFALVPILSFNFFAAIMNQIYDVDIDRINKPDLPLVSGEMSIETAWILSIIVALTGLIVTIKLKSAPLFVFIYIFGIFAGIAYSVPPIRWKQYPFTNFLIIISSHVGLAFTSYSATTSALGLPFVWRPAFSFIIAFMTVMGITIAFAKDISDIEGDAKYGVSTVATKLGARNMTFAVSGVLLLNYLVAISIGIIWPRVFKSNIMILSHAILAFCLIFQTRELALANYASAPSRQFFEFIWLLYYAEYFVYVFI